MKLMRLAFALGILALGARYTSADVWDEGGDADNSLGSASDNELWHGTTQVHDLGALPGPVEDVDYFSVYATAFHSYEALIVGTTGDLNAGGNPDFKFDRLNVSAQVVQSFLAVSPFTFSRAIAWEAGTGGAANYLRVSGPGCGTACTAADQYTLRFYDTTYSVPRFNNSGSQTTTLIVQNESGTTVTGTVWYFNASGATVGNQPLNLPPQALAVIPTGATVPGQAGSILISHNGHYGSLSGKAVALEPSTGFTFDTALTPQPD